MKRREFITLVGATAIGCVRSQRARSSHLGHGASAF
jgi:hypothetical protein